MHRSKQHSYSTVFAASTILGMPDKLLKRDLSEHRFAQDLPKQRVDRSSARHVHERAPRIDAVVVPRRSPVARRPDETLGEVALLCARISCLDFQATVEAYVHVRLNDRVLGGGETLSGIGEVPNVTVGCG